MCGLIAAIGDDALGHVDRGLPLLDHRGIRSQIVSGHDWAIGHRRLPIVGIDAGNDQPQQFGNLDVAFVGEILNFRDINPDMECDVELVGRTLSNYGPRGFNKFDGFWSVVWYDHEDKTLHALTDYLAQKPLYIRDDLGGLIVASELDALADLAPTVADQIYLASVLKFGYCPDPVRTPYRQIKKVPPGVHMTMTPSSMSAERTDRLEVKYGATDHLKDAIIEAVRLRVESSDVPVACLVSGGLDSAIAYTIGKRYGDLVPFHVENGEWDACARICPSARLVGHMDVPLKEAMSYMQEPVDLGSLVPQTALSKIVGNDGMGYNVCLTGDGADEAFGGYSRSARYDSQMSDIWQELLMWHLPRLDRVMMRNRVEVRSPFLAREVMQYAMSLPWPCRAGDKGFLRNLFRDDLPQGVADTPKRALRTSEVQTNREKRSRDLVKMFKMEKWWP